MGIRCFLQIYVILLFRVARISVFQTESPSLIFPAQKCLKYLISITVAESKNLDNLNSVSRARVQRRPAFCIYLFIYHIHHILKIYFCILCFSKNLSRSPVILSTFLLTSPNSVFKFKIKPVNSEWRWQDFWWCITSYP